MAQRREWEALEEEFVTAAENVFHAAEALAGVHAAQEFANARQCLRVPPRAQSAVSAFQAASAVAAAVGGGAAFKAAKHAALDVVVIRCCSAEDMGDKDWFIMAAKDAFGCELERQLSNELLHSYHKCLGHLPQAFRSNSKIKRGGLRGLHRGGPRMRPDDDGMDDA